MLSFCNIFASAAVCNRDLAKELGGVVLIGALPRVWRENKDILPKRVQIVCKKYRLRGASIYNGLIDSI